MENQQSVSAGWRSSLSLFVVVLYVVGLAIWTPLFLFWPRRYAGMTVRETVATRYVLVRHIWTGLVRTTPRQHVVRASAGRQRGTRRRSR